MDSVQLEVIAYSNHPSDEAPQAGCRAEIAADARIDRRQLVANIEEELRGQPYVLGEHYEHYSWGAEGASLRLVLEVSTVVGGAAGVVVLFEKLRGLVGGLPRASKRTPAEEGRVFLANVLRERPETIVPQRDVQTAWGHRVDYATPHGRFVVESLADGSLAFSRLSSLDERGVPGDDADR